MTPLIEALETLAQLLEARKSTGVVLLATAAAKKKLTRGVQAVGFKSIGKNGKPTNPSAIAAGDTLYIQRMGDAGAGIISKNPSGQLFGIALDKIPAGKSGSLKVALFEKAWETDGSACPICDENAIAGWLAMDDDFPSGDDEPPAHPNCKCSLRVRRADDD